MRRRYLVTYDISDDKRLQRTFKALKDYGEHLQYSVFICDLNSVERIRMEVALKEIINEKSDQVLIVDLGLTRPTLEESNFYVLGRSIAIQPRVLIA